MSFQALCFSRLRIADSIALVMLKKIERYLKEEPGKKARAIAAELGEERAVVSKILHDHPDLFSQDDEFQWYLVLDREHVITFKAESWLTANDFEAALVLAGSPLDSQLAEVKFVLGSGSKIMIDALARLLALCNQLAALKKAVTVDLSACKSTLTYLDRFGFFNHLHASVSVLPSRPRASLSTIFEGNSDAVVELLEIDPSNPNQNIPLRLGNSFARCAGAQYSVGAFTVLAELFRNVEEHSESRVPGFAGLQFYKRTNHIQTVISDSGIGIVESLRPVLSRYPQILKKVERSQHSSGVALLMEVFSEGGLSKVIADGRGLGLKQSGEYAKKFKAKISVRQSDFELRVFHDESGIRFSHSLNLVRLDGTHICFDLKLDGQTNSH